VGTAARATGPGDGQSGEGPGLRPRGRPGGRAAGAPRETVSGLPRQFWWLWTSTLVNRLGGFVVTFRDPRHPTAGTADPPNRAAWWCHHGCTHGTPWASPRWGTVAGWHEEGKHK
jgi:hypothetical protein